MVLGESVGAGLAVVIGESVGAGVGCGSRGVCGS